MGLFFGFYQSPAGRHVYPMSVSYRHRGVSERDPHGHYEPGATVLPQHL